MSKSRPSDSLDKRRPPRTLVVRLDEKSKAILVQAAQLRRVSLSDYVREVTVPQAQREVEAAREQTLALSPQEQLEFWTALSEQPELTEAQQRLGSLMRGES
jgi:uncharacterized protein (DUF1778 family)